MPMKNRLKEAQENNSLVSIYVDSDDWGRFSLGYVDLLTDTHVRIRALSNYGEPAGFEIRPLSEIVKIEVDGKYERKLERLSKNQGKIFAEVQPRSESEGDLIRDTLQQSLDESVLIVVWGADQEDSLVGYVEKLESDLVTLHLIDEFGEDDGVSTIGVDEVTSIDFNARSEQVRSFLYKAKRQG